jgi:hypothetical protein
MGFGGSKEGIFVVCCSITVGGGMGRFDPLIIVGERGCSGALFLSNSGILQLVVTLYCVSVK